MVIIDGGPDSKLPNGSGGPILAGPQAVFVAGRVAADAPTTIRIADWEAASPGDLVLAYEGTVETPLRLLRVVDVDGGELASVQVGRARTFVRIYLTDLEEPDEVLIAAEGVA